MSDEIEDIRKRERVGLPDRDIRALLIRIDKLERIVKGQIETEVGATLARFERLRALIHANVSDIVLEEWLDSDALEEGDL